MTESSLAEKLQIIFTTPATILAALYAVGLALMLWHRSELGSIARTAVLGYACLFAGSATSFYASFLRIQIPRRPAASGPVLDQDAFGFAFAVGLAGATLAIVGSVALLMALLKTRSRASAV